MRFFKNMAFFISTLSLAQFAGDKCLENNRRNYLEDLIPEFSEFTNNQAPVDCISCITPPNLVDNESVQVLSNQIRVELFQQNVMRNCVYHAMKTAPDKSSSWFRFVRCFADPVNDDQKHYGRKSGLDGPCLTKKYFEFVYKSYVNTMQCLGIKPVEMFPIINHESGFQLNIGNRFGVYGTAQITGEAVAEMHRKLNLGEFPEFIVDQSKFKRRNQKTMDSFDNFFDVSCPDRTNNECLLRQRSCNVMKQIIEKPIEVIPRHKSSSNKTINNFVSHCERAIVPQNPSRSLLYGGLIYLDYKKQMKRDYIAARSTSIKEEDLETIMYDLILYAYNGGIASVGDVFEAFILSQRFTPQNKLSFKKFHDEFPKFLNEQYMNGQLQLARYEAGERPDYPAEGYWLESMQMVRGFRSSVKDADEDAIIEQISKLSQEQTISVIRRVFRSLFDGTNYGWENKLTLEEFMPAMLVKAKELEVDLIIPAPRTIARVEPPRNSERAKVNIDRIENKRKEIKYYVSKLKTDLQRVEDSIQENSLMTTFGEKCYIDF